MEQQIDGFRAWIAMEKARKETHYDFHLTPLELLLCYAIKLGHNTCKKIATFRGFVDKKQESKMRIANELSILHQWGLVTKTGNAMATSRGNRPELVYGLTDKAKAYLKATEDQFDHFYYITWDLDEAKYSRK
jgi:hypothetical protein